MHSSSSSTQSVRPRREAASLALCGALLLLLGTSQVRAQVELLELTHPATAALVRLYEAGSIPSFPREHLPISRGDALRFLREAAADRSLDPALRALAQEHAGVLVRESGEEGLIFPGSDSQHSFWNDPLADRPLAIAAWSDSAEKSRVLLEPIGYGEVRFDPKEKRTTIVGLLGAGVRVSLYDVFGAAGRIVNGSVAGDSALAARDSALVQSGSFGITGFGRDIGISDAHARVAWKGLSAEIGHDRVQLGGGLDESLLLGSRLGSSYDYLRLGFAFGPFRFTHLHGWILDPYNANARGPLPTDPDPQRFVAAHLLSVDASDAVRISLGEATIYHGRGIELGYLNPLIFFKDQEQYQGDRDNGNMYLAVAVKPVRGVYAEGEMMLDDLRFSEIGSGYWSNKIAWRIGARATGLLHPTFDFGANYTRVEPFTFSHFNPENAYTHRGMTLAGENLQPNSWLGNFSLTWNPSAAVRVDAEFGVGEHGANIISRDSATGLDTLVLNAGGDVAQTHRAIDPPTATFLDGRLEQLTHGRLMAHVALLGSAWLFGGVEYNSTESGGETVTTVQLRIGLTVGGRWQAQGTTIR